MHPLLTIKQIKVRKDLQTIEISANLLARIAAARDKMIAKKVSRKKIFISRLLRWHKRHGRHNLPWRKTRDPWRILISEIMLQQTQVERVIPIYRAFF